MSNLLSENDFNCLNHVLKLCAINGVALTLHWSEAENAWWASIDSPVPSEETITKTYSFDTVMNILDKHLEKL